MGFKKLQKACFDEIKRHRLATISEQALAVKLDDQRRMAYVAR